MEGFYRKEGGTSKLAKEKEGLFQALLLSLKGKSRGSYYEGYIIFLQGMERAHKTDLLIGVDNKTPD